MSNQRTIGSVLWPVSCDLEAYLRVHRLLVERSLQAQWRFEGNWVVSGPFESLMGKPCCGSSLGSTHGFSLDLYFRDGIQTMIAKLRKYIINTLCQYPEFASLGEKIRRQDYRDCQRLIRTLMQHECARTRAPFNRFHKRATLVRDVGLFCCDAGISLNASVSFNTKPGESRWGLFYLVRERVPRWNERLRLDTWLAQAEQKLASYLKASKS